MACQTRKVDDLVNALGIDAGVSKSQVSRICGELDGAVNEFRERRLDHIEFPYVFFDATYVKAHEGAPGSCPKRSSSPPEWLPTATVKSSASPSATAKTKRSGRRSCGRYAPAVSPVCVS